MRIIQGSVVVRETGKGVGGLTITAFSRDEGEVRTRVGSVATAADGQFRLEATDADTRVWNLELEVSVDGVTPHVLYADAKPRSRAGAIESWTIRLPLAALVAAGVLGHHAPVAASDLPALGTFLARAVAETSYEAEVQSVVRGRLDPKRDSAAAIATIFRTELVQRGRGGGALPVVRSVRDQVAETIAMGLTAAPAVRRPRIGFASVTAEERAQIEQAAGSDGTIPASLIEPLLDGRDPIGERTVVNLLAAACRSPRTLDEACPDVVTPPPTPTDPGDPVRDLADAVWAELQASRAPEATRPSAADVWRRIEGLDVSSGPADAPALFDFHAIHIPFEDVWRDLVDDDAVEAASQLHAEVDRLGGRAPGNGETDATDKLRREARFLTREAPAAKTKHVSLHGLDFTTGVIDPLGDDGTRWVSALLDELERKLAEPYRFTVYASRRSRSRRARSAAMRAR